MQFYIILLVGALFFSSNSSAETVKVTDLQKHCAEVQKGAIGQQYDEISAHICNSYMNSFFDSMIITEKLTEKEHFCVPSTIPKVRNTQILDAWIKDNPSIAEETTASVALFAAFKTAFPCKVSKK